ncbi:hypothetical protein ABZ814_31885 [Micromonospora musae]|uniref:hypothetical protein n=1 Tax=Micromonospora musae TaxID=1894970 RepID=UPI0033FF6CB3
MSEARTDAPAMTFAVTDFADGATEPAKVDVESRTITGLAVPYNKIARKYGLAFRFKPGSLEYDDANLSRIKHLKDHYTPVGIHTAVKETASGPMVTLKVLDGPEGSPAKLERDQLLYDAAHGLYDGLSVGVDFSTDPESGDATWNAADQVYDVKRATWRETSSTPMPAFDDARVTKVRASREGAVMPEGNTDKGGQTATTETTETTAQALTLTADEFAALKQLLIAQPPADRASVDPTARPVPTRPQAAATFARPANPLAYTPQALSALQGAIDARDRGRFVAADPTAQFATLTTSTIGARREWGSNVMQGPRLLHVAAGMPRQSADAIYAQFPQLTLPTASASVTEGTSLTEYASSTAGTLTMGRFGRFTDLSGESLIGADAEAIVSMHRLGIALDMDKVLIDAVETAAGTAATFSADVPGAIRKAMAKVMAATATDDPADVVVLVNPDDINLLQDVSPVGGQTMGERFQRFSGALVYPSTAVNTGFMTVANLRVGARYFEAAGLQTVTDTNVKTDVQTVATFIIGGYGVTLASGFAAMVDVVTG